VVLVFIEKLTRYPSVDPIRQFLRESREHEVRFLSVEHKYHTGSQMYKYSLFCHFPHRILAERHKTLKQLYLGLV
jgi:hypothetical protein